MFLSNAPGKQMSPKATFSLDVLITIIGTFLYSLSVVMFTAPNQIAPGGVSGISTVINYLLPWANIGAVSFLINVPLVILGFIKLGKDFMIKTGISLVFFTIFTDYVLADLPPYTGNMLLASVFGGALMGIGLGLILWRAGSSGGSDIICKIMQKSMPHIKMGTITFITDFMVIVVAAFIYGTLEAALYAIICVFVCSKCIDLVIYGFDVSKTMIIISDHLEEISAHIIEKMERGATIVEATGAYTGERRPFILCAVSQKEYVQLARIVKQIDPRAFMIVMNSGEIIGEGFRESLDK